ncbi:uncharacterized protein LOC112467643 [Temnothorax curvispinosus]|uniref:Uncharacterized protein LOC112467643 n=1 Tax=Temnothorax curvispinosus TaxID=300111 RepID=A0A6J1RCV8_9HYME|nr:uncharacterized protein LOC112467643 [Temnothorax curvispinosus]
MLGIYIVKKRISFRWVNRQYWVRPINVRRPDQGDFNHLLQEVKNDPFMFFRNTRMFLCIFNQLLEMMTPFLVKKSHRALIPEQRLALTLRFLATGDQVLSIALAYRIGESTAHKVIKETCAAIIRVLCPYICHLLQKKIGLKYVKNFGQLGTYQTVVVQLTGSTYKYKLRQILGACTSTTKKLSV